MSGLKPVEIVEYDPQWPLFFDALHAALESVLNPPASAPLALTIQHVGSTAVPGLAAKPIIDLDVVIESERVLPDVVARLHGPGYRHQGDQGIPGREALARKGEDVPRDGSGRVWPVHHLYVCAQDSRELARHLALRDYLRADDAAARAYGDLKRGLARQFASDREAYTQAKTRFIEDIYRRALL